MRKAPARRKCFKLHYDTSELAFLSSRRDMPRGELHALFVDKFHRGDVTLFNLKNLIRRERWISINARRCKVAFNKAELLYALFVREFGRADVTLFNLKRTCQCHGLFTGHNAESPVGYERRHKDRFIKIKVAEGPRNFRFKHRVLWERLNGPIPWGHRLKCIDGNRANTDPSNWEMHSERCFGKAVRAKLRECSRNSETDHHGRGEA